MTYFNPLSPCGERLLVFITIRMRSLFQSTLPMRGETGWIKHIRHSKEISIHSPHAGRDSASLLLNTGLMYFNPLSPCGERRYGDVIAKGAFTISIHSPHAGRDAQDSARQARDYSISIHSPHAGRDGILWRNMDTAGGFQSTLPMRGET